MATPEKAVSNKFTFTPKPVTDSAALKPALPRAKVNTQLVERDGVEGIEVTTFFPVPENEQIEVTERMGRNTLKTDPATGEVSGADNSNKVASILKVIGRASKVDLVVEMPNDPNDESKGTQLVALTDQDTVMKYTGTISLRIKGEGADDDETED